MLEKAIDWLVYDLMRMHRGDVFSGAINFFLYDTLKIFGLILVTIFLVAIIRTFFSPERTRALLTGKGRYSGHILGAALGIVTPFCSCSAVPLFLGFVEAGIPLGGTFSFLIASPMINEVAAVMLWGLFGWQIALTYIASGMLIAIVSGIIIGKLKPEALLEKFETQSTSRFSQNAYQSWKDRTRYAWNYTKGIFSKIWLYIVIGVGIGAWIHGYVPADFLAKYAGRDNIFAVPLATLIGIPLYSNAAGVIPLVSALTEKGMAMGTALAFMMAVTALSIPEFLILRRVMKPKLLLIFASIVGIGIIFTGYIFNSFLR